MKEAECIWPLKAELGEGPIWDPRDEALWFVDIRGGCVHRFHPASGAHGSWDVPGFPSFILPVDAGGFIVGRQSGLHHFVPSSSDLRFLGEVEPDRPGNRLNDASVGPDGSLWFGSMDNAEEQASGAFYRLHPDGRLVKLIDKCRITNGPAFSPDGRTFYHTDSALGTIFAADLEEDGSLANRRPFVEVDPADGAPDGTIVDSEGCLWVGLWGGWRARRYAPDASILEEVRLPVAYVTKIALGGPDLKTAFVTTAGGGLGADELADQPLAGSLFAFEVDVPGLAPTPVPLEPMWASERLQM